VDFVKPHMSGMWMYKFPDLSMARKSVDPVQMLVPPYVYFFL
jgi:hypothetical protein